MSLEWVNTAYWDTKGQEALSVGDAEGKEKQRQEIERLIEELEKERLEVQAMYAKAVTGKLRVTRDLERVEEAFKDIATKREFANVASSLNHPAIQVISEGAEWPLPRFRRAIQFGSVSGVLGFVLGACLSVLYRMVVKPAFEA
jgi:hypothetical protein